MIFLVLSWQIDQLPELPVAQQPNTFPIWNPGAFPMQQKLHSGQWCIKMHHLRQKPMRNQLKECWMQTQAEGFPHRGQDGTGTCLCSLHRFQNQARGPRVMNYGCNYLKVTRQLKPCIVSIVTFQSNNFFCYDVFSNRLYRKSWHKGLSGSQFTQQLRIGRTK